MMSVQRKDASFTGENARPKDVSHKGKHDTQRYPCNEKKNIPVMDERKAPPPMYPIPRTWKYVEYLPKSTQYVKSNCSEPNCEFKVSPWLPKDANGIEKVFIVVNGEVRSLYKTYCNSCLLRNPKQEEISIQLHDIPLDWRYVKSIPYGARCVDNKCAGTDCQFTTPEWVPDNDNSIKKVIVFVNEDARTLYYNLCDSCYEKKQKFNQDKSLAPLCCYLVRAKGGKCEAPCAPIEGENFKYYNICEYHLKYIKENNKRAPKDSPMCVTCKKVPSFHDEVKGNWSPHCNNCYKNVVRPR